MSGRREFRVCATCAHFRVLRSGVEVRDLQDTMFIESECEVFRWRVREHPLMAPCERTHDGRYLLRPPDEDCAMWTSWRPSRAGA